MLYVLSIDSAQTIRSTVRKKKENMQSDAARAAAVTVVPWRRRRPETDRRAIARDPVVALARAPVVVGAAIDRRKLVGVPWRRSRQETNRRC